MSLPAYGDLSRMNAVLCLSDIYFTLCRKSPVYLGGFKLLFTEK